MSNVSQWATSESGNNAQPPNGAPEGMAPSTANDVMREIMAGVRRWHEETSGKLTTGGVADSYTLTTSSNHQALADQSIFAAIIHATNTGASTLNVDALGAKSIKLPDGTDPPAGALPANTVAVLAYVAGQDVYVLVGGRALGTAASKDVGTANGQVPDAQDAAILDRVSVYSRAQVFTPVALTDGANISWDLDVAQVAKVTLGGDRQLDNPTNMRDGGFYSLQVIQDATGGRNLTYGSAYDFGAAGVPGLTQTASFSDELVFKSDGAKMKFHGITRGFDET